jgi:hypothetical protein
MTRAELRLHVRQIRIIHETDTSTKQIGREWYEREQTEARSLAKASGLELRLVCACLAILSSRCDAGGETGLLWRRACRHRRS